MNASDVLINSCGFVRHLIALTEPLKRSDMTRVIQWITQFYLPPNPSHTCLYTQPQSITFLWPVLIAPTLGGMARLSWPGWLVRLRRISRIRSLTLIRSPIPVLTGPGVDLTHFVTNYTNVICLHNQICLLIRTHNIAWHVVCSTRQDDIFVIYITNDDVSVLESKFKTEFLTVLAKHYKAAMKKDLTIEFRDVYVLFYGHNIFLHI